MSPSPRWYSVFGAPQLLSCRYLLNAQQAAMICGRSAVLGNTYFSSLSFGALHPAEEGPATGLNNAILPLSDSTCLFNFFFLFF